MFWLCRGSKSLLDQRLIVPPPSKLYLRIWKKTLDKRTASNIYFSISYQGNKHQRICLFVSYDMVMISTVRSEESTFLNDMWQLFSLELWVFHCMLLSLVEQRTISKVGIHVIHLRWTRLDSRMDRCDHKLFFFGSCNFTPENQKLNYFNLGI